MTYDPVPQRLSDAERDVAAQMLREHFEAGRLDTAEFDERLSAALSARIASDFEPLFADLPAPRPDRRGPSATLPAAATGWTALHLPDQRPQPGVPVAGGSTDWIGVARGIIWPVAIILAITTGNWWTFIILAIVGSIVLKQIGGNQRKPPPYLGR